MASKAKRHLSYFLIFLTCICLTANIILVVKLLAQTKKETKSLAEDDIITYEKILKVNSLLNSNDLAAAFSDNSYQIQQKPMQNSTLFLYPSFRWMINNQIYQYSTYFLIKNKKEAQIECITGLKQTFAIDYINKRLRCVVRFLSENIEIKLKITQIYNYFNTTKKFVCILKNYKKYNYKTVGIAVINLDDYIDVAERDTKKLPIHNGVIQLPKYTIVYQKPIQFKIPKKKQRAIAHCIHLTYNINEYDVEKLLTWLAYQRQFDMKKIIFYDINSNNLLNENIIGVFSRRFIEIRPYKIEYELICDKYLLDFYKYENLQLYTILKDNCEQIFYNYFDNPIINTLNRWKHQKINANDCYTNLKYLYEFVSLYDFDEFIYPRLNGMNNYTNDGNENNICDNLNDFCRFTYTSSMYSYVHRIIEKNFKNSIKKLTSLYFMNAFYLYSDAHVDKFMDSLNDLVNKNQKYFLNGNNRVEPKNILKIQMLFTSQSGHIFTILPNDHAYILQLIKQYKKLKCLYDNYNKNLIQVNDEFKRFLYVITNGNHRLGKSIHYTNNVDAIFTHYATKTKDKMMKYSVSSNIGLLSHFRVNHYSLARNFETSIRNLNVDYEYYTSLIVNYGSRMKFKCDTGDNNDGGGVDIAGYLNLTNFLSFKF